MAKLMPTNAVKASEHEWLKPESLRIAAHGDTPSHSAALMMQAQIRAAFFGAPDELPEPYVKKTLGVVRAGLFTALPLSLWVAILHLVHLL